MKLLPISVLLSIFLTLVDCSIINPEEKVICNPTNTSDCYPKIFKPTTDWQIIKPNQEIPAGLHVRLNIESLEKEAKLMTEETESDKNQIVVDGGIIDHDDIGQKFRNHKINKGSKKIDKQELTNFDNAVKEVQSSNVDKERLAIALDTIEELSHDIEFGSRITSIPNLTENLLKIGEQDPSFKDQIYRTIASSTRNNPNSVDNIMDNLNKSFIDNLFTELSNSANNDDRSIIPKRILGILQGLIQNKDFKSTYFHQNGKGTNELIKIYPHLPKDAKVRVVNIFQDLNANSDNKRDDEDSDTPDYTISNYIQNQITTTNDLTHYPTLVNLHESNRELKPSSDFLNWLTQHIETMKNSNKRDGSNYEYLLTTRHQVFGNPMGLRKAMADEL